MIDQEEQNPPLILQHTADRVRFVDQAHQYRSTSNLRRYDSTTTISLVAGTPRAFDRFDTLGNI